jgi:hypothetical protein
MNSKSLNFFFTYFFHFFLCLCTENSDNKDTDQVITENKEPKDSTCFDRRTRKDHYEFIYKENGKSIDDKTNFKSLKIIIKWKSLKEWQNGVVKLSHYQILHKRIDRTKIFWKPTSTFILLENSDMCWYSY